MTAMIDASQYCTTETLRNGFEICIRAARPDDAERVVEAFHKLAPDSVYLRFFGPKKELSASDIQRFREADFSTRVVLIATIRQGAQEIVIASGTYVRTSASEAEIAFTVIDDYHRLGIARRLLTHLGRIATDSGITTFSAEVLPHNKPMLGVFERSGWPMTSRTADGTTHITLDLRIDAQEARL